MVPSQADPVVARLRRFIEGQYAANAGVTLAQIRDGAGPPYRIHPRLAPFIAAERERILPILRAEMRVARVPGPQTLFPALLSGTSAYIQRNNQFLALSRQDRADMRDLYRAFLAGLTAALAAADNLEAISAGLGAAQTAHLGRLRQFIAHLAEQTGPPGASLVDVAVVCAEYAVETQLQVLGIQPDTLAEPILEVGCGSGALVGYLRGLGLEACGIDRLVAPAPYLQQADWLEYSYLGARWGTIISHMAFSNHFIFHHQYRAGRPDLYARKYMEMLAALQVGGALYYAPGLPFIEPLLPPARFAVHCRPVPLPLYAGLPAGERAAAPAPYATRIVKLAL